MNSNTIKKATKSSVLKFWFLLFLLFLGEVSIALAQTPESKITELQSLISQAESKGIDTYKEKMTIRTAEIFLKYAIWDENHIEENKAFFELVPIYKKEALKKAQNLADFERNDVIMMLDATTANLKLVLEGKVKRKPSPIVDWRKVSVENDQLTYNKRPVFLADYTWKPKTKELSEYHGNLNGFFITPPYLQKSDGTLSPKVINELNDKPKDFLGFVFMNHKNVPDWAEKEYGPNFKMREDTYTAYDIDNPGARKMQQMLIGKIVPKVASEKISQLGYMLCNEPHFFTQAEAGKKLPWASGSVSHFTIEKFKIWLQKKHENIAHLNNLWGTNFASFNDVSIAIPIDISLQGTPIWYDWASFNMDRVTDWFSFLKSEVVKNDPEAKVHLKIMPNLWTDNKVISGIDLEALTNLSGIIGNDSGAEHNITWGNEVQEWKAEYAFDWRELCMGFDFMKSVSPNKINFNSELHYLSTVRSRDLYMDPMYVRAAFWLAHSYGMTASQIWFWPREEDGSVTKKAGNGYAGSNNQQPRVTNEVASTIIDLNANAEEIMAMQRQRKPLRIFYSKTSGISKKSYMDDIFKLYESIHFEGLSTGFVTQDILNTQQNTNWDIVLITDTPFVTSEELKAIQSYIKNGGTVIMDDKSLLKDEYGKPISVLNANGGKVIQIKSIEEMKNQALATLKSKNLLPEIEVIETNSIGKKACDWKVVKNSKGNYVLSIVNIGKTDASLTIKMKGASKITCTDILKGVEVTTTPVLKPCEVYFVEIVKK